MTGLGIVSGDLRLVRVQQLQLQVLGGQKGVLVRERTTATTALMTCVAGKRLDYQAQRVRASLAYAIETAETQRAVLADQAADMTPAEVEQAQDQIDREERQVHDYHRDEIYVGFNELEALLPRADALAAAQPCFPAPVQELTHRPLPAMPSDLAACL